MKRMSSAEMRRTGFQGGSGVRWPSLRPHGQDPDPHLLKPQRLKRIREGRGKRSRRSQGLCSALPRAGVTGMGVLRRAQFFVIQEPGLSEVQRRPRHLLQSFLKTTQSKPQWKNVTLSPLCKVSKRGEELRGTGKGGNRQEEGTWGGRSQERETGPCDPAALAWRK